MLIIRPEHHSNMNIIVVMPYNNLILRNSHFIKCGNSLVLEFPEIGGR